MSEAHQEAPAVTIPTTDVPGSVSVSTAAPVEPIAAPDVAPVSTPTEPPPTPQRATGDLLGQPLPVEPPVDTPPAAAPETPAEAPPVETEAAPPPEPIVYDFKFPEALTVAPDDPLLGRFTETANELRLPPEKAQALVDLYGEAATNYATSLEQSLVQRQFDVFNEMVTGWAKESQEAPEWNNRFETVLNDARRSIDLFGGTPAETAELREILFSTGAGNHKAMIRTLYNAISRFETLEGTLAAEGLTERPAVQRALADFRNPYREARPGPRPTPTPANAAVHPADRRYGTQGSR